MSTSDRGLISPFGVADVHPGRSVVARLFPAAHVAVDARLLEPRAKPGIEEQMIDAQPGIALIGIAKIVPERIDLCLRVQRSNRIRPALPQQLRIRLTNLDPEERIVHPAPRLVHITLGGDDVVIAGEHHGGIARDQLGGVTRQSLEPAQLVVEPGTWCRIPVREIETADDGLIDPGFEVAAVDILGISRKRAADFDRLTAAGEDGDAVPALLAVTDDAVARRANRQLRKLLLRRLELLQADDIRGALIQPAQEIGQARRDAVDVVGDDPHQ